MKVTSVRKGLLFVIVASTFGLGCELIVDFDRTRIPVEGSDGATVTPDGSVDANFDTSTPDTSTDGETPDTSVPDADADAGADAPADG